MTPPSPRCFVKAKTLPVEMEAQLTAVHGKPRDRIIGPAVEALTKTLDNLSSRVREAQQQGPPVEDAELSDLVANLDITPGEAVNETANKAAEVWATMEDQDDVVEAMRQDAVEVTAQLAGTLVNWEEEEEEAEGGESTGGGGGGVLHLPTLNFRRTLASWRRQRQRAAMERSPSPWRKPGWQ